MDDGSSVRRPRAFLFLQGPPGEAFSRLADGVRAQGHKVYKINFNPGDQIWWRSSAFNFRGPLSDWPSFLGRILRENEITDVALFGDCRPFHRLARALASRHAILVHVFEEGYIRPDWVTMEVGGVNGNSSLPRSPDWYRLAATNLPRLEDRAPLPPSLSYRKMQTIAYYGANILLSVAFPHYRTHRPASALQEAGGWIRRLVGHRCARRNTAAALDRMSAAPFYLFPLQIEADAQIRYHSNVGGVLGALETVVASFARHAPADHILAIKQHPLDSGLRDWRRITRELAEQNGVADRVIFSELGNIDDMVRGAVGVVTVNSTTGTLALASGTPVKTLGYAVYDLPGLTHQGALDAFWTEAELPDARLYDAFQRVLAHSCLISGGFFGEEGISRLVEGAIPRLMNAGLELGPGLPSSSAKMADECFLNDLARQAVDAGRLQTSYQSNL